MYGHELSGVVEEVGEGVVSGAKPGDRVIIEPAIPCGSCYPCLSGKYNCCIDMKFVGSFGGQGGFADYVAVPERCIHPMPDEMEYRIGALCEPFTIGAQAVKQAGVKDGMTVTILGMGPIGLTILILLKQLYAVRVFAVDVVPERLLTAKQFGADVLINPLEADPVQRVKELTGGEYSNAVIEVAGLKRTMEQTIHLVSAGGHVVIVGLTSDDVSFPGILFTKKEVEIRGSRNSVDQFPFIIDFLSRNRELADAFITATMPFRDIAHAFHETKTKPNAFNKIILMFDEV
ncbi:zinc-binding dehydrogenase [Paenibacillus lignilyticus]|uniref:zinc-binding dehydrogenase n=1 Tax=Paenibacillus lignilyticus TaxID=1172615 RepID=UPI00308468B7